MAARRQWIRCSVAGAGIMAARARRMKIERVDSFTHAFVGMVRVICDDGMAVIPNAGAYLTYSIEPDSY